jgi:hypothetical protein
MGERVIDNISDIAQGVASEAVYMEISVRIYELYYGDVDATGLFSLGDTGVPQALHAVPAWGSKIDVRLYLDRVFENLVEPYPIVVELRGFEPRGVPYLDASQTAAELLVTCMAHYADQISARYSRIEARCIDLDGLVRGRATWWNPRTAPCWLLDHEIALGQEWMRTYRGLLQNPRLRRIKGDLTIVEARCFTVVSVAKSEQKRRSDARADN